MIGAPQHPFAHRPPRDAYEPRPQVLPSGPLTPCDQQAHLAAHEEATSLIALGLCDDARIFYAGPGKYIVHAYVGEVLEFSCRVYGWTNEGAL